MGAHKDRLIQAADLLGMDPDDLLARLPVWQGTPDDPETGEPRDRGPSPEGFAVFAHWSAAHDGINVEVDAPEGLPLTIHVNDWRAVNVVVGTDAEADPGDEPWPHYGPAVLPEDGPYALHYVSQDCPSGATWSVYREQYVSRDHDEPIDGSQEHVSTHATEADADAEANRLQAGAAR